MRTKTEKLETATIEVEPAFSKMQLNDTDTQHDT